MYVRSAVVKGVRYYQLAEGHRDEDGKVRTKYVLSLGQHATPEEALDADRHALARLRRRRMRTEAEDRRIEKLTGRVEILTRVVDQHLVSTTADRAERRRQALGDDAPKLPSWGGPEMTDAQAYRAVVLIDHAPDLWPAASRGGPELYAAYEEYERRKSAAP